MACKPWIPHEIYLCASTRWGYESWCAWFAVARHVWTGLVGDEALFWPLEGDALGGEFFILAAGASLADMLSILRWHWFLRIISPIAVFLVRLMGILKSL
jgi:hypothetical protein